MSSKRRLSDDKASSGHPSKQTKLNDYWLAGVPTRNQYETLADIPEEMEFQETPEKPPPIFVHGVVTSKPLEDLVKKHAGQNCKMTALQNHSVKIQVQTIDVYRSLLKDLKEKNTDMHSYQPKSERSLRVVIKNLHHSTTVEDITASLQELGHSVVNVHNIRQKEDVDEAVHHVTTAIQSAAWAATPAPILPIGSQVVPVSVREKVKERRQLRRRWQTTRNPDDKAKFNRASKELKDILSNIRNTAVNKYLSDLTPTHATNYSLWKAARRVRRMEEPNPPIKNSTDSWARTDKEKADVFAQHMKELEDEERVFTRFHTAVVTLIVICDVGKKK
ncbi:hypothetical protein DMENIID0001_039790 [Sergentomyia squamirostris]